LRHITYKPDWRLASVAAFTTQPIGRAIASTMAMGALLIAIGIWIVSYQIGHGAFWMIAFVYLLYLIVSKGRPRQYLIQRYFDAEWRKYSKQQGAAVESASDVTVALEDDGVKITSEQGYEFLKWEAVRQIAAQDVFAHFDAQSSRSLILPRAAFGSDQAYWEFIAEANRLRDRKRTVQSS
jgi:hypothetical protein